MMTPQRKRELKDLIRAKFSPTQHARRGFKRPSLISDLAQNFGTKAAQAGTFVIFAAVIALFGIKGMIFAFPLLIIVSAVILVTAPKSEQQRLQELGKEHHYQLCVWCTHPIAGLPDRAPCPECGVPYDLKASATINGSNYNPLQPDPKIVRRRRKYAFARLLRERDRNQPSSP